MVYEQKKKINIISKLGFGMHDEVSLEKYLEDKDYSMKFAYNYIAQNSDKVYVTTTDLGSVNADVWLDIQMNLLPNNIQKEKFVNRKEAIKKALINAKKNDVILICGRGNRRIMCDSENHITNFVDKDKTLEIIKELEWEVKDVCS